MQLRVFLSGALILILSHRDSAFRYYNKKWLFEPVDPNAENVRGWWDDQGVRHIPQRNLEVNLQRKLALLKELEKEYSQIASLGGGEWGLGGFS